MERDDPFECLIQQGFANRLSKSDHWTSPGFPVGLGALAGSMRLLTESRKRGRRGALVRFPRICFDRATRKFCVPSPNVLYESNIAARQIVHVMEDGEF